MRGRLILATLLLTCTSLVHAWEHSRLPDIPPGAFDNNYKSNSLGKIFVQPWYARALVNPSALANDVNTETRSRLSAFSNIVRGFGAVPRTEYDDVFDLTAANRLGLDIGYVAGAGFLLGGRISRLHASDDFYATGSSDAGDSFSISGDVEFNVTALELLMGFHMEEQAEGSPWSSWLSVFVGFGAGWASVGANAVQNVDIVGFLTETLSMAPEYKQPHKLVGDIEFLGGLTHTWGTIFGGGGYQLASFGHLKAPHNFDYDGDGTPEIPKGLKLNYDLDLNAIYFKIGVGIFF